MSAGTMIACSCREIVMGEHSNLGPIDPQFNGISCHGVIEEFDRAVREVKAKPHSLGLWQTIIGKYHPTFLGDCEKAISWSEKMVEEWLMTGMFKDDQNAPSKVSKIVRGLLDHSVTKNHARHIHMKKLLALGVKIADLKEERNDLQDTVLTIHHAFMHTFSGSIAAKIIENHRGLAFINNIGMQRRN